MTARERPGSSPAAPASSAATSCATRSRTRGDALVVLDLLTYAGSLENLRDVARRRSRRLRAGRHRRRRSRRGGLPRPRAGGGRSTSRPRATWIARSTTPRDFLTTNVVGTFELLEGARRHLGDAGRRRARSLPLPARLDRRGLRHARRRRPLLRGHALRAELALLRLEGRRRPLRARLPAHLRRADARHELLEQLRAVPVPREADPADDPERARGQAAPDLRRRRQHPRLALRRGPLRGHPAGAAQGPAPARSTTSAAATSAPTSQLVDRLCALLDELRPARENAALRAQGIAATPSSRASSTDRPGHDRRYAIDAQKIRREIGWEPRHDLESGLARHRALVPRATRTGARRSSTSATSASASASPPSRLTRRQRRLRRACAHLGDPQDAPFTEVSQARAASADPSSYPRLHSLPLPRRASRREAMSMPIALDPTRSRPESRPERPRATTPAAWSRSAAPTDADGVWSSRLADWFTYGALLGRPRRRARRLLHGRHRDRARALRAHLLDPHVRNHRRLPPLLLAQDLQDEPRLPVRARAARNAARRRRARSGGRACTASTTASRTAPATSTRRSDGFWYSHQGWIFDKRWQATRLD